MANDDDKQGNPPGKPGPVPSDFSSDESSRFLRLIEGGLGVYLALKHIGVGHGRYKRTLANDPDFKAEVDAALAARAERLVSLAYKLALGNKEEGLAPDVFVLKFMINRDDLAVRYRQERKERRRLAKDAAQSSEKCAAILQGADPEERQRAERETAEWQEEMRKRAGGGSSYSSAQSMPPT